MTGIFTSDSSDKNQKTETAAAPREPVGAKRFEVGDRYTFDNPVERWEVMEIRDDRVYWRNEKGERKVTGFNPLLPDLAWQSRVRGSGRRLIRDREGALFPMRVGASLSFRETVTTDRPPFGWERIWRCSVEGRETLRALGGSFQTFVVHCEREGTTAVRYHYASEIGNFMVMRTEKGAGQPDDVRNLLAFETADGIVRAGMVPERAGSTKSPIPGPVLPDPKPAPAAKEPERADRAVNPSKNPATDAAAPGIVASLVLTQPVFGGRTTPPAPLPPEPDPAPAAEAPSGDRPPPATPAPLAAVQQAEPSRPAAPRPVRRAVPQRQTGTAAVRERTPRGPRMAPASVFGASRPRIPVPPPPAAVPRVPPPPAPVATGPSVPPPPKPAAIAPSVPPPPVPTAPAVPPARSAAEGQRMVHLASYRSVGDAEQGWQALRSAHTELLQSLKPKVRPVVVKGRGTYYRLYAGPLASDAAADLCRKLKGAGVFCVPTS